MTRLVVVLGLALVAGRANAYDGKDDRLTSQTRVTSLAFDSGGRILAVAGHSRVGIWEVATGSHVRWLQHGEVDPYVRITDLAFIKGRLDLVSSGTDGRICVWDVTRGSLVRVIREPWVRDQGIGRPTTEDELRKLFSVAAFGAVGFGSIAISQNGRLVAAEANDGTVQIWRIDTGAWIGEYGRGVSQRHVVKLEDVVTDCRRRDAWGRSLGKTSDDGKGWDSVSEFSVWEIPPGREGEVGTIVFDGNDRVVFGALGGDVELWEVETRRPVGSMGIDSVFTIGPDRRVVVSFDRGRGSVCLYRTQTGEAIRSLEKSGEARGPFAFANNGKLIVGGGSDQSIRVWSTHDGGLIRQIQCPRLGEPLRAIAISPDGGVVAGYWDAAGVRLWDTDSGRERLPVQQR